MVSLASEFPNDNPALHRGVIWVCTETTGGARPERTASVAVLSEPAAVDAVVPEPAAIDPVVPEPAVPGALSANESLPSANASIAAEHTEHALDDRCEAETAPVAEHESLAPPEDDDADEAAGPILVEELEPIEACLEGEEACLEGEEACLESEEACLESEEASLEGDACAATAAASIEIDRSTAEEPNVAPPPAESEVVLVKGRTAARDAEDAADAPLVAPVFDEVVANEVPQETTSSLPPAPDDPFTVLVCTLADVAIGAGSPHVASLLPGLLFDGRLPEALDPGVADALRAAGILNGDDVAPSFVAVTAAWRAILRGTSEDFDACGAAMLDEWASDLLARLLEAPARAPMLRQELRSRGVAAFGLAA